MSVPVFKYWMSLSIRRNRLSFFLAISALFCMLFLVVAGLAILHDIPFPDYIKRGIGLFNSLSFPLLFLLFICFKCILITQRLHDFSVPGWVTLLIIISLVIILSFGLGTAFGIGYSRGENLTQLEKSVPYLIWSLWPITMFILSLIPGTKGKNDYGEDSLKR